MKKKILNKLIFTSIFILIILNFSLENDQKYVNEKFGFSIIPPEGWKIVDKGLKNLVVTFLGPYEYGVIITFGLNIVYISEGENLTIDDEFISEIKEKLCDTFKQIEDFKFIYEGKREVIGLDGYEIVLLLKYKEDIEIIEKVVFFIENNRLYTFAFASHKKNYDIYLPLFEKSLSSFQIL